MGSFVPDGVLTNGDLERLVDTSDRWIMERTGVRERRMVGNGETASVLGAAAARRALDAAGNPHVDAILVATSSPDTLFPSTACLVQRRLGLGGSMAMDVSAACSGFVYGLTLADSLVRAGTMQRVLVIAAEAMTTLIDYKDRSTCVLFGDGAGAAVVGASGNGQGIVATRTLADGGLSDIIYYGPGQEEGQEEDKVRMSGRGTFRLAVENMSDVAVQLCEDAGWTLDDVTFVVPHQANLRIVEAVAKRLALPMERVVFNGDRYGNTSAASIPLALDEAHRAGRLRAGDRLLCLAFGAGATWGGVAMEWALDAPR
ncbi:MAG TPA: beta-ketoacyl-ACP synthase III [Candidatus Angelobacter sp.]|nr:beta-ketoacyl-ACP synthase III [Candidatus Angelobacter sp.]